MLLKVCKNANLALAFLLELCVLAALLYWGFSTGPNIFTKIALIAAFNCALGYAWKQ